MGFNSGFKGLKLFVKDPFTSGQNAYDTQWTVGWMGSPVSIQFQRRRTETSLSPLRNHARWCSTSIQFTTYHFVVNLPNFVTKLATWY